MAKNSIQIKYAIRDHVLSAVEAAFGSAFASSGHRPSIVIDRPAEAARGDYTTSVALAGAKIVGTSPVEFAIAVISKLNDRMIEGAPEYDSLFAASVDKIEVAGPGFINFYLKHEAIAAEVSDAALEPAPFSYGRIDINAGKKIAYEYTDPNPFKVFHIGHLMANAIGESLSRIGEFSGAEIRRFCYQGDLGRHVALFVYGLRLMDGPFPTAEEGEKMTLVDRMYYMGTSYAKGATYFKGHPEIEPEIQAINKKLYERSDDEVNAIYDLGLEWSLEYFETLYDLLGTKFDQYFFESKCVEPGRALIAEGQAKGVFVESEGAIVFEGEKFAGESEKAGHLHTRVFITKFGLPTYDAKELGLAKLKYDAFRYDKGIVVTANEQDQYFKVNLKVQSLMIPELTGKNTHISHGMMTLPTGKMSSRTGDVVSAEEMIESARSYVLELMKDREMPEEEKRKTASQVAIAGIKYLILRQSSGKNVVYDPQKALAFDGDSGPYLQYACVRARSVVSKAAAEGILPAALPASAISDDSASALARKIFIFPEIIERAHGENSPHFIATYLIELAAMFNAFYAQNKIIDASDDASKKASAERVALTRAVANVLANGLYALGIEVPEKM